MKFYPLKEGDGLAHSDYTSLAVKTWALTPKKGVSLTGKQMYSNNQVHS